MEYTVQWLGQAGYLMTIGKTTLCIDPYLSNSVEEIEGLKRLVEPPLLPEDIHADYMLFTHDHLDHFDEPTLRRITDDHITYIGPGSCTQRMDWILPQRKLRLDRGTSVSLGELTIRAVFAAHTGDSIGFLIQADSKHGGIYLTGDTLYDTRLLEVKRYAPSVLYVCINGKLGNMDCCQAVELARSLNVRWAIPCHYGMFAENTEDPDRFLRQLDGSGIVCCTLPLGQTQTLTF